LDHLKWAGKYVAEHRPDTIVCLGDFGDIPSFSVWEAPGSLHGENKRYQKDLEAVWRAMDLFMAPIERARGYRPNLELTLGNHEHHITREIERNPRYQGIISLKDLRYEEYGWTVHPFLHPIEIGGFHYSHYFPSGIMGRPCTNARKLLNTYHVSCVAGHQQGREVAYAKRADGRMLMAIIAGSFYQHDETYLTPLANKCWRGCLMLNEVADGEADELFISINYLKRKFG
jgi:hypothetical protein